MQILCNLLEIFCVIIKPTNFKEVDFHEKMTVTLSYGHSVIIEILTMKKACVIICLQTTSQTGFSL